MVALTHGDFEQIKMLWLVSGIVDEPLKVLHLRTKASRMRSIT